MAEDIVGKVISFFAGDSTENLSDKEVVLRQRLKELGENKYAKFYRQKTGEADPSLGIFFHSLYRMVLPARTFMRDTAKITRLRQIVLEAFMNSGITETARRLNPTVITEQLETTPPDALIARIREDIDKITEGFDDDRINGVNKCYNLVMVFFQLANYDYPSLLKNFDPNFTEGLFAGDPKFSPVKLPLVVKDLAEFLAISQGINPDSDWKTFLKLLGICAGEELLPESQFTQMMIGLRDVINSKIIELMVQYGGKNPVWICKSRIPDEHIAEAWLETRTARAQECIDMINTGQKNNQIDMLVGHIFTNGDTERLENYTETKSEMYHNKELSYFEYARGLNYLSAFLSDYVEADLRELCDILLIRGQWTNNAMSKEMSEAFHQLLALPEVIARLDEMLSDDGSDGTRLKAAVNRVDRDRTQVRYINSIIDNINEQAQEMLNNAVEYFTVVGRHLQNLADDVQKKHPEMIINWRELNSVSKNPLPQQVAGDQKKVNDFIQLLRLCAQ